MKTVFSKEVHGNDAESLHQFVDRNRIEQDSSHATLRIDKDDWIATFYKATNGKFYFEKNSCGYEIYLHEFDSEVEYQSWVRNCLLVNCSMGFLANNNPT